VHAGKSAAAVRYDALTALYTALSKQRVTAEQLKPLLTAQAQLVPLIVQSMDEDWYADTRKLGCFVMSALLSLAGTQVDDELRRQVYPELTKRMDDSSNDVRIAAAATLTAFAEHALPAKYCDTNSGCAWCHLPDPFARS
jgi:dynein assembly factor 5, axonemal